MTVTTEFEVGEKAYVKIEAEKKGALVWGFVSEIVTKTPGDSSEGATGTTHVFYKLSANAAFPPPKELFREDLLVGEDEAKELAAAYHRGRSDFHANAATSLS